MSNLQPPDLVGADEVNESTFTATLVNTGLADDRKDLAAALIEQDIGSRRAAAAERIPDDMGAEMIIRITANITAGDPGPLDG
jgi:hypothetical protein